MIGAHPNKPIAVMPSSLSAMKQERLEQLRAERARIMEMQTAILSRPRSVAGTPISQRVMPRMDDDLDETKRFRARASELEDEVQQLKQKLVSHKSVMEENTHLKTKLTEIKSSDTGSDLLEATKQELSTVKQELASRSSAIEKLKSELTRLEESNRSLQEKLDSTQRELRNEKSQRLVLASQLEEQIAKKKTSPPSDASPRSAPVPSMVPSGLVSPIMPPRASMATTEPRTPVVVSEPVQDPTSFIDMEERGSALKPASVDVADIFSHKNEWEDRSDSGVTGWGATGNSETQNIFEAGNRESPRALQEAAVESPFIHNVGQPVHPQAVTQPPPVPKAFFQPPPVQPHPSQALSQPPPAQPPSSQAFNQPPPVQAPPSQAFNQPPPVQAPLSQAFNQSPPHAPHVQSPAPAAFNHPPHVQPPVSQAFVQPPPAQPVHVQPTVQVSPRNIFGVAPSSVGHHQEMPQGHPMPHPTHQPTMSHPQMGHASMGQPPSVHPIPHQQQQQQMSPRMGHQQQQQQMSPRMGHQQQQQQMSPRMGHQQPQHIPSPMGHQQAPMMHQQPQHMSPTLSYQQPHQPPTQGQAPPANVHPAFARRTPTPVVAVPTAPQPSAFPRPSGFPNAQQRPFGY
jgi:hypothetical protein